MLPDTRSLGRTRPRTRPTSAKLTESSRWWRLAADQGFANAQYELGIKYDEGQGVPQDYVQAHMWFNLAASRSTGESRERAVRGRDQAADELTPAALNEAQRLAREWDAAHPREP